MNIADLTGFEHRVAVEMERANLLDLRHVPTCSPPLYGSMSQNLLFANAIDAKQILAICQPHTEIPAPMDARVTKVPGCRYPTLVGLIDEVNYNVIERLYDGTYQPWFGRFCQKPDLTIVGEAVELRMLALPRDAESIEALLRRRSGMKVEVDWMLKIFGINIPAVAHQLATLSKTDEDLFIAVMRRQSVRAIHLFAQSKREMKHSDWQTFLRAFHTLVTIDQLFEMMRAMAPRLIAASTTNLTTVFELPGMASGIIGAPLGIADYIDDGWMFMKSLDDHSRYNGSPLSPHYKLTAHTTRGNHHLGNSRIALSCATTFDFMKNSYFQQDVVAGTQRTLFNGGGSSNPLEFAFGCELMRLPFLGLKQIAQNCRHRGATKASNRTILGRLAAYLLREVDHATFAEMVERWKKAAPNKNLPVTVGDIDQYLTHPGFMQDQDLFTAQIIRAFSERCFWILSEESNFNPAHWMRRPNQKLWRGIAASHHVSLAQVGAKRAKIINAVVKHSPNLADCTGQASKLNFAVRVLAEIGPYLTPLAKDPTLFERSLVRTGHSITPGQAKNLRPSKSQMKRVGTMLAKASGLLP